MWNFLHLSGEIGSTGTHTNQGWSHKHKQHHPHAPPIQTELSSRAIFSFYKFFVNCRAFFFFAGNILVCWWMRSTNASIWIHRTSTFAACAPPFCLVRYISKKHLQISRRHENASNKESLFTIYRLLLRYTHLGVVEKYRFEIVCVCVCARWKTKRLSMSTMCTTAITDSLYCLQLLSKWNNNIKCH